MPQRHIIALVLCLVSAVVGAAARAPTQQPQAPAGPGASATSPRNLQVLPRDFTQQQVVQVMQTFAAALGVTCAHCHAFLGAGNPMNDMASDGKPQKNVARAMMRMVADINARLTTVVQKPAEQRTRVECVTCHRGAAIPAAPAAAPAGRGAGPQG